MTEKTGRFHVIEGSPAPDTAQERQFARMRKMPKPPLMLECPRCAGHAILEIKLGVLVKNSKPYGGTKQLICAMCATRGQHVVIW